MYGRVFALENGNDSTLFTSSPSNGSQTMNYKQFIQDPSFTLRFDPQAKAAYGVNQQSFVTLDSVESITCKREYAKEHGLMGLMCWEYGGDAEGALLRAMHG